MEEMKIGFSKSEGFIQKLDGWIWNKYKDEVSVEFL